MATRMVKDVKGNWVEIDESNLVYTKSPWYESAGLRTLLVQVGGFIITVLGILWTKSSINNRVDAVEDKTNHNTSVITDVKKEVQHQGRIMGRPPITAEVKE